MTPTVLAALQEGILDRSKAAGLAAGRMPTDRELADVAGVDPSIVSHWRRGRREMGLAELVRLADRYGAEVLGGLLEHAGAGVAPPALREVLTLAVSATAQQAALAASVHSALADGSLTDEEADDLLRQVDQAAATTHRVRLAIERRRRVAS